MGSGGQTGHTYDISNKHRLGYSEVQLVQTMIDGVNTLWKEDLELQRNTACKFWLFSKKKRPIFYIFRNSFPWPLANKLNCLKSKKTKDPWNVRKIWRCSTIVIGCVYSCFCFSFL